MILVISRPFILQTSDIPRTPRGINNKTDLLRPSIKSGGRNIILCLSEWVRLKHSKRASVSEYSQQEREQNVSRRWIQKGRGASTWHKQDGVPQGWWPVTQVKSDISPPHIFQKWSHFLRTTTDDLEGLFDKYGRIGDVYIPKDYRTKESRGFGFVRYFNKWVLNADFGSHWRADESISKQFTDISIFLITFLLGMTLKTPSTDWTDASMMGGSWVSSMQGEI